MIIYVKLKLRTAGYRNTIIDGATQTSLPRFFLGGWDGCTQAKISTYLLFEFHFSPLKPCIALFYNWKPMAVLGWKWFFPMQSTYKIF